MTTPITSSTSTPITDVLGVANSGSSVTRTDDGGSMDKNAFLKLLVAQLKYQDPSSPVDSSQFMSQTAQFQQVETMTTMADSTAQLLAAQRLLGGSALIGRTVTYTGDDGKDVTGLVTAASFSSVSGATMTVGTGSAAKDVAVGSITKIEATGTSAA